MAAMDAATQIWGTLLMSYVATVLPGVYLTPQGTTTDDVTNAKRFDTLEEAQAFAAGFFLP
jgi:hypothetical protein